MLNNKEEVSSLKEENKELEEKLKIKWKIEFKDNFYYIDSKWPYCSRCWEKDKNLIRSIPNSINSDNSTCPECKTIANFTGKEKIHKVIQQNVNRFL
jgi:phage FluMu protein Com